MSDNRQEVKLEIDAQHRNGFAVEALQNNAVATPNLQVELPTTFDRQAHPHAYVVRGHEVGGVATEADLPEISIAELTRQTEQAHERLFGLAGRSGLTHPRFASFVTRSLQPLQSVERSDSNGSLGDPSTAANQQ